MSISTIRRQVKNVAYNFSDAQVKVREATSNDPWGPSTALMSEIADLTNNPMAFTEIMSIVWKRLNDSGKNWRHVYKSLVLLDFLIKCGNEKVAQQCRENIFTIETLKDFQHIEENRDQGLNIREKAKQIVSLLSDEERLKNERTRFMLTRNKFKQNYPSSFSEGLSTSTSTSASRHRSRIDHPTSGVALDPEFEEARPTNQTEEEMQLQIALALSREEHEKMDEMRKSDEVRLQLALEESRKEAERMATLPQGTVHSGQLSQSALDDLLSLGVGELIGSTPAADQPSSSAWGNPPASAAAGSSSMAGLIDPWAAPTQAYPPATSASLYPSSQLTNNDPWAPATASPLNFPAAAPAAASTVDPFSVWDSPTTNQAPAVANNDFSSLLLPTTSTSTATNGASATNGTSRKTPENFLGENKNLVNLDDLLGTSTSASSAANPFLLGSTPAAPANPFQAAQRKSPTLNEMRAAQQSIPPLPQSAPKGVAQPNPFQSPF